MLADLFLAASIGFVLISFIGGVIDYFQEPSDVDIPPEALWIGVAINATIFVILPAVWLALTVQGGWDGIRERVGLHGGLAETGIGAGLGVVLVIVLGGAALVLDKMGVAPDNAPIEDLLANVTWPLAIAFSLVAGVGEELLFRGVLQKWLRWWGQGLVFGALHFANAGLFAFFLVGSIGLLFGYLRHRGMSLWTLMAAHFVYDMILLSVAIMFPDLGGTGGPAQ